MQVSQRGTMLCSLTASIAYSLINTEAAFRVCSEIGDHLEVEISGIAKETFVIVEVLWKSWKSRFGATKIRMSQAEIIMQVEQTALTAQGSSVAAAIVCCIIYFLFFASAVHSFIATSEILASLVPVAESSGFAPPCIVVVFNLCPSLHVPCIFWSCSLWRQFLEASCHVFQARWGNDWCMCLSARGLYRQARRTRSLSKLLLDFRSLPGQSITNLSEAHENKTNKKHILTALKGRDTVILLYLRLMLCWDWVRCRIFLVWRHHHLNKL